jgi:hypothetical protein
MAFTYHVLAWPRILSALVVPLCALSLQAGAHAAPGAFESQCNSCRLRSVDERTFSTWGAGARTIRWGP